MGRLIDETDLMNLLYALDDARYELFYAIKKISELPSVDAISKADYEARLKADLEAILTDLYMEIEELDTPSDDSYDACIVDCEKLIQEKINNLQVNNSKVKEQDDAEL